MRAQAPRSAAGFTLIELLVAIAVLALLAIVSWRGLDAMVRAHEQTNAHTDAVQTLQTVLDQWGADLDAVQTIEHTSPIAWDGQVLRLTRHSARPQDEGVIVVAWALSNSAGAAQWLRWQSAPVATRTQWNEAWQRAEQWARSHDASTRRGETVLMPLADWHLYFYRDGSWANALSSSATQAAATATGAGADPSSTPAAAAPAIPMPEGLRLELTLPEGAPPSGRITRDWVNPVVGGNKS